ncbi:MAG: PIN domain-containing protein [Acidimicrobiales bacterium]
MALLDADLAEGGPVTVVAVPQDEVETRALGLVRDHAIKATDAWHLATAMLVLPSLVEPGEEAAFTTRDQAQSEVVTLLGLRAM